MEGTWDKFTDTVLCVPVCSSSVTVSNSSVEVERDELREVKSRGSGGHPVEEGLVSWVMGQRTQSH